VIKVDRHKYVKLAYHGFKRLSSEERDKLVREEEGGGPGAGGRRRGQGFGGLLGKGQTGCGEGARTLLLYSLNMLLCPAPRSLDRVAVPASSLLFNI
jgi:hypothetical protein